MRVAVIGTGNIGGTIGAKLAAAGHEVVFGSRAPGSHEQGDEGRTMRPVGQAISDGDVVLLAIPGRAVGDLVAEHGAALSGQLVVDATNQIGGGGPANAHATIVDAVPGARYARAFNTLGWENFAEPAFGDAVADMFFSSSDADRPLVEELITAVGLRPVHVGEDAQDVVDGLLPLWFALSRSYGRHVAFKLLHDPA